MPRVVTSYICPPIPFRNHDWCAYFDNDAGEESAVVGHGCTEDEAIADLLDNTDVARLRQEFGIKVVAVDQHRGPEYGHFVAIGEGESIEACWADEAVADLAFLLIKKELAETDAERRASRAEYLEDK